MIEHCILGIDPGASGAIAFYFPSRPELVSAEDVPLAAGEIDAATLARRINQLRPTMAVIEQALGVPMHLVTPGRWKKHFRLDADKEKARALAIRLWPASRHFERKKDHGRAEAALLARFGTETLLPMIGEAAE